MSNGFLRGGVCNSTAIPDYYHFTIMINDFLQLTIIIQVRQLESEGTEDGIFINFCIFGENVDPNGCLASAISILSGDNVLSRVGLKGAWDIQEVMILTLAENSVSLGVGEFTDTLKPCN